MSEQISVTIRDSVLYDPISNEELMILFFPKRTITARELICERVLHEVQAYNQKLPEVFHGLVAPAEAERVLNGFRMAKQHLIDAEKQCQIALQAFEQNGFILMVDELQMTELDQKIELRINSIVIFHRLTPLVGG
jgi:hypothetical protein